MYVSEHNPPHFHVWYENYKAEIIIEDGIITGTLPRCALNLVYEWLDLHKNELMNNWKKLVNFEKPDKIAPLQ